MILTEEQESFITALKNWHSQPESKGINIQSAAGVGKTSCLAYYAKTFEPENVIFIAPTHAALAQLRNRVGSEFKFLTVAKALQCFPVVSNYSTETRFASFGGKPFDESCLIIVDESSMLSEQEILQLLSLSTKIIFSGDVNQLAPVKKKSGCAELQKLPQLTLTKMMRADSQALINAGLTALDYSSYIPESSKDESVINYKTEQAFYEAFFKEVINHPSGDCVWITRTNEEVQAINNAAHIAINGRNNLKVGDKIRLYSNSKLGHNNTIATVSFLEKTDNNTLIISTEPQEDGSEYKVEAALPEQYKQIKKRIESIVKLFQENNGSEVYEKELKALRSIVEIDYPYAITVHKSQGASIPIVFANTLKLHGRKAYYVAYSRASKQLHVVNKKFKTSQVSGKNSAWFNEKFQYELKANIFDITAVKAEIEHIYGTEATPSSSHLQCVLNPAHNAKSAKGWYIRIAD